MRLDADAALSKNPDRQPYVKRPARPCSEIL
jgi:hypothetical protein